MPDTKKTPQEKKRAAIKEFLYSAANCFVLISLAFILSIYTSAQSLLPISIVYGYIRLIRTGYIIIKRDFPDE